MYKKIVLKIGSSVLAPGGKLDRALVAGIVEEVSCLRDKGIKIVIVSSGAIACGVTAFGRKRKPSDISSLQAFASLGQVMLMEVYAQKFKKHEKMCGQVLLTWDDFNDRRRYLNARNTIEKMLSLGVVPVVNENDAISNEEIKFGDNDRLSALVGDLIGADLLLILSNVRGLLCGDKLIPLVEKIDSRILSLARKEDNVFTAGGMLNKLEAVKISAGSGIRTVIADGSLRRVIAMAARGDNPGTLFLPGNRFARAKKRWIAFNKKIKGRLFIDSGAEEAVMKNGKSLLFCGIVKVEGDFTKKDAVEVITADGSKILGCGLVEYGAAELAAANRRFEREVIHRNNFVNKEV